jgi:hypothetical protein
MLPRWLPMSAIVLPSRLLLSALAHIIWQKLDNSHPCWPRCERVLTALQVRYLLLHRCRAGNAAPGLSRMMGIAKITQERYNAFLSPITQNLREKLASCVSTALGQVKPAIPCYEPCSDQKYPDEPVGLPCPCVLGDLKFLLLG